jgi:hypothetical protein
VLFSFFKLLNKFEIVDLIPQNLQNIECNEIPNPFGTEGGYLGNPITKTSVLEWYKYLNHQGHEGSDTRNEEYGFIKLE